MSQNLQDENLKNLSHGVELISQVIINVAGDDVSSTLNGERIHNGLVQSTVAAKLQSCLLNNKPKDKRG